MRRILLTLAAIAAFVVPAAAYAPQNNLFLELTGSRVYYHDEFLMLEDLQELIKAQEEPVNNVIVTADAYSSAVMMLGIRDYVAEVSSAQVIFIFPKKMEYPGDISLDSYSVFTIDKSPYFEPLSNEEYYSEQALWEFNQPMPEETMGVTVLLDSLRNGFYMGGKEVHWSVPINYLLEDFKMPAPEGEENECEAPYYRVKITDNTTVGDLLTYETTITWYALNKDLQIQYAFFSPDTRVANAAAFNLNPTTLDDVEIGTVYYAKPEEYSVAPTYYGYSDMEDILTQIGYYVPGNTGHNRGRAVIWFTVCIDGSVKDIEQESGMIGAGERVRTALEKAPPFWSQAKDNEGNPVNMRYRIKMKLQ